MAGPTKQQSAPAATAKQSEPRTRVPPLHRGQEEAWVRERKADLDLYAEQTDRGLSTAFQKAGAMLRRSEKFNRNIGKLNVSVGWANKIADGESRLMEEILDEITTGPAVNHRSVQMFAAQIEARKQEIIKNQSQTNMVLGRLEASLKLGALRAGLSPAHRLLNHVLTWGLTIVLIVAAPFGVFEGLDITVTDEVRQYTVIGQWLLIGVFSLFRAKDVYDAAVGTRDLAKREKEEETMEKLKPAKSMPRLKLRDIDSRHWWEIWNERWADWRAAMWEKASGIWKRKPKNPGQSKEYEREEPPIRAEKE